MSQKITIKQTVSFPVMWVLFFIFLVLKLTGVIAWSWWWVTAPLWGGIAIFGIVALTLLSIALIVAVCADPPRRGKY